MAGSEGESVGKTPLGAGITPSSGPGHDPLRRVFPACGGLGDVRVLATPLCRGKCTSVKLQRASRNSNVVPLSGEMNVP